jgi:hypothetical protein
MKDIIQRIHCKLKPKRWLDLDQRIEIPNHRGAIVWGAVGLGSKSELIFIDGTLNSQGDVDFLKDTHPFEEMKKARGDRVFHFHQDGASPHTAKTIKKYLAAEANIDLIPD